MHIKITNDKISILNHSSKYIGIKIVPNNMLYKYGVRINSNLARDYNNSGIKLTEYSTVLLLPFPWDYFPVISGKNNHKISRGIRNIMTQFPSTIDTIKNNISKHILLQTSEYSTTSNLMDFISFNDVNLLV